MAHNFLQHWSSDHFSSRSPHVFSCQFLSCHGAPQLFKMGRHLFLHLRPTKPPSNLTDPNLQIYIYLGRHSDVLGVGGRLDLEVHTIVTGFFILHYAAIIMNSLASPITNKKGSYMMLPHYYVEWSSMESWMHLLIPFDGATPTPPTWMQREPPLIWMWEAPRDACLCWSPHQQHVCYIPSSMTSSSLVVMQLQPPRGGAQCHHPHRRTQMWKPHNKEEGFLKCSHGGQLRPHSRWCFRWWRTCQLQSPETMHVASRWRVGRSPIEVVKPRHQSHQLQIMTINPKHKQVWWNGLI